jgi:Putative polyhydroxyalkanoic acid system protein (PHA_gran_rgn)
MARLNITIEHGLPPEVAQARFRAAIVDIQNRFSGWIQRVDWADDGRSATLTGTGFEIRCWFDERELHVQGSIPLAWKLFEGLIRNHIKADLNRTLPAHRP